MRIKIVLLWASLVLVPLLAYSSALSNDFVWDDHHAIEHGRLIDSPRQIPTLFFHDTMYNSFGADYARTAKVDTYRPLTMTTFFVERALFAGNPRRYHLDSVLFHVCAVLLVYAVGKRLGVKAAGALLGALLFAVHPAISEAVHWINGRSDPLCLVFFLLALWVWLGGVPYRTLSPTRQAAVALLVLLATLCKETAFMLVPPVVLLLGRFGPSRRRAVLALAPWGVGAALGAGCRLLALRHAAVAENGEQLRYALVRLPVIWLDGLRSLLFPIPDALPSLFEHYRHVTLLQGVLAALGVASLAVAAIWGWRRQQILLPWALASFFLTLAPISVLTYLEGWAGWGRYLYCSAALLSLAAMAALSERVAPVWPRLGPSLRTAAPGIAAWLIAVLGVETFLAGRAWRDDRALALEQIADHPEISTGYSSLAVVESKDGHFAEALRLTEQAIAMAPAENYQHYSRQAWALIKLGRRDEAFAAAAHALRLQPSDPNARYLHALALIGRQRQSEAAAILLDLVVEDPAYTGPWSSLREALSLLGANSDFARVVRAAQDQPRYGAIAARLRELP